MKKSVNFKKEIQATMEQALDRAEEALKKEGFGVLTRIDFDKKMKEKLNRDLPPVVILGACSPPLAWDAYQVNSDVTSVLPCNVVVREVGKGRVSIEIAKPSAMMEILGEPRLVELAREADGRLARVLEGV